MENLLRDQTANTWHKLVYCPDHKNPKIGSTEFEASWCISLFGPEFGFEVSTRDRPGEPSWRVGSGMTEAYLNTPIFIPQPQPNRNEQWN